MANCCVTPDLGRSEVLRLAGDITSKIAQLSTKTTYVHICGGAAIASTINCDIIHVVTAKKKTHTLGFVFSTYVYFKADLKDNSILFDVHESLQTNRTHIEDIYIYINPIYSYLCAFYVQIYDAL